MYQRAWLRIGHIIIIIHIKYNIKYLSGNRLKVIEKLKGYDNVFIINDFVLYFKQLINVKFEMA